METVQKKVKGSKMVIEARLEPLSEIPSNFINEEMNRSSMGVYLNILPEELERITHAKTSAVLEIQAIVKGGPASWDGKVKIESKYAKLIIHDNILSDVTVIKPKELHQCISVGADIIIKCIKI